MVQEVKTVGDLIRVLSVYDKNLPLDIRGYDEVYSNSFELTKYIIGSDLAITAVAKPFMEPHVLQINLTRTRD